MGPVAVIVGVEGGGMERRRSGGRGELVTVVILAATFCLSVAGFLGALALRDGGASDVRLPRILAWSDVAARLGLGGKDEPSTAAPGAAEWPAAPTACPRDRSGC